MAESPGIRAEAAGYRGAITPSKVLYVVPNLEVGGTERQVLTLIGSLDRRRYAPQLVCIEGLGPLVGEARSLGLEPHVVGRRGRFDLGAVLRLARLIRRERPHIVHSWLYLANFYGRLAGRLAGVPVIIASERAALNSLNPRRQRVINSVDRLLSYLTDCITANSQSVKEYVKREGIRGRKVAVIYNGVRLPEPPSCEEAAALHVELGIEPGRKVVGMVARLDPEFKDHPTFLRAASIVRNSGVDAHFLVVGDGPARSDLEGLATELGLGSAVTFTRYRRDAQHLHALLDVSVLCSFSEGFSNVLLEAMACGTPVVATDIPPNREAILDGVNGLLVPVRNPAATAEAIRRLLVNTALARELGENARERAAENFSVEANASRTMQLYDRMLARNNKLEEHHRPRRAGRLRGKWRRVDSA